MMLQKLLSKLEDPRRPLLAPTIKLCELFGVLHPANRPFKYFYTSLQILLQIFSLLQIVAIWYLKDDTNVLLGHMNYAAISFVTGVKIAAVMLTQDTWRVINDYVTAFDIEQRKSRDSTNNAIIRKNTKYCRILTYGYVMNAVFSASAMLTIELVKYFFNSTQKEGVYATQKGVKSLPLWVPFDTSGVGGWLANYALTVFWSGYGSLWLTIYDTHMITLMVAFKGELELLRRDSANIFGDPDEVTDEEAKRRIKTCHTRFVLLTEHVELLNSCLSSVKFVHVGVCSFMICTSAYQFKILSGSQQLVVGNFLAYVVAQLFLYCWHSNEVLTTSMELARGPYESRWWGRPPALRRCALLLAGQFRRTLVFTAGPFADLTVATFVGIMKGAYSYYTLLSQSQMQ